MTTMIIKKEKATIKNTKNTNKRKKVGNNFPTFLLYFMKYYLSIEPKTFCAKEFKASLSTIPFATFA